MRKAVIFTIFIKIVERTKSIREKTKIVTTD